MLNVTFIKTMEEKKHGCKTKRQRKRNEEGRGKKGEGEKSKERNLSHEAAILDSSCIML